MDSIHPDDLAAIAKWFNKEIGVLQTPYKDKLRLVLGIEDGILEAHIKKGEVFVVHTHPVFRSNIKHFGIDISNAGEHTEAVVDWSGQIIYFNKKGVINPSTPDGFLQSMPDSFKSAFIDANGHIVGYANIKAELDVSGKITIKVVE